MAAHTQGFDELIRAAGKRDPSAVDTLRRVAGDSALKQAVAAELAQVMVVFGRGLGVAGGSRVKQAVAAELVQLGGLRGVCMGVGEHLVGLPVPWRQQRQQRLFQRPVRASVQQQRQRQRQPRRGRFRAPAWPWP